MSIDQVRGHTFDGIEEYDNKLPNWWLMTFIGAVIFSFIYWGYYHIFHVGPSSAEAYKIALVEKEKAEAAMAEKLKVSDEILRADSKDAEIVAKGKQIFLGVCLACHRIDGGGMPGLGPNLTDKFWKHGGKPMDLYKVVTEGVKGTAMVSQIAAVGGVMKIKQVLAYVLSLRNTNVANGKAKEGEPYEGN